MKTFTLCLSQVSLWLSKPVEVAMALDECVTTPKGEQKLTLETCLASGKTARPPQPMDTLSIASLGVRVATPSKST